MLNFTIEKPIINATANAEIFIIPNRACKLSGILDFAKDEFRKLGENVCAASGTSFDESKDYFVETWITAEEDLGSENLADHGFRIKLSENLVNKFQFDLLLSVLDQKHYSIHIDNQLFLHPYLDVTGWFQASS